MLKLYFSHPIGEFYKISFIWYTHSKLTFGTETNGGKETILDITDCARGGKFLAAFQISRSSDFNRRP